MESRGCHLRGADREAAFQILQLMNGNESAAGIVTAALERMQERFSEPKEAREFVERVFCGCSRHLGFERGTPCLGTGQDET